MGTWIMYYTLLLGRFVSCRSDNRGKGGGNCGAIEHWKNEYYKNTIKCETVCQRRGIESLF